LRAGDILIPQNTLVASCGDIIFIAERTYYIDKIIKIGEVDTIWVDSEMGDWVLFEHDIQNKFVYKSIRREKILKFLELYKQKKL
jgi:riboflavin synthase alpha subunit